MSNNPNQPNLPTQPANRGGAAAPVAVRKPTPHACAAPAKAPVTTPVKGAMTVAPKDTPRKECEIITRLKEREGADSLYQIILQLTGGDTLFVDKFVECCKQQVNRHWKRVVGKDGKMVWTNPFLQIPINSQLEALYKCASKKVLPDGYNCNLVPYIGLDEKKVKVQIDYKGLIDCGIRDGVILDCGAEAVCVNDDFEWSLGEVERWRFDPRKDRGGACGYCAWAILPNGRKKWQWMSNDEITQVRECAKTKLIWDKWTGEMSKKTVIRRLFKTLPNSPKLQGMLELDNDTFDLEEGQDGKYALRGSRRTAPVRRVVGAAPAQLPAPDQPEVDEQPDAAAEAEPEMVPAEAPAEAAPVKHQSVF